MLLSSAQRWMRPCQPVIDEADLCGRLLRSYCNQPIMDKLIVEASAEGRAVSIGIIDSDRA